MRIQFGIIMLLSISIIFASLLGGCQRYVNFLQDLPEHRSPMVKYPAYTGLIAGGIVGVPLEIPYIPIWMIWNPDTHGSEGVAMACALLPIVVTGMIGETTLGVPCWCLFGWWWPETKAEQPITPEEQKIDRSPAESTKKDSPPKGP